jgi:hypothetical protein
MLVHVLAVQVAILREALQRIKIKRQFICGNDRNKSMMKMTMIKS